MSEDKSKIIIPKRATKTKLASSESVLKEGEIALIYPDTGPGTGAAKLVSGDGATIAKNLPIAIDGEAIDELRESLDIAKKIIPITLSLTGWKSANGDNSAPYVQTVINEELKSSMNPDLVSMLDESATPEKQEIYNKNLAIISQGVGTVNNGSITYKVYKLPSADITIGLTRLGGVKEVENTVDLSGYVPYTGATQDLNLGNNALKLRDDYEKTNTTTDSDGNQTTTTKTVEQSAYLKLKRGSADYDPQVIEVKRPPYESEGSNDVYAEMYIDCYDEYDKNRMSDGFNKYSAVNKDYLDKYSLLNHYSVYYKTSSNPNNPDNPWYYCNDYFNVSVEDWSIMVQELYPDDAGVDPSDSYNEELKLVSSFNIAPGYLDLSNTGRSSKRDGGNSADGFYKNGASICLNTNAFNNGGAYLEITPPKRMKDGLTKPEGEVYQGNNACDPYYRESMYLTANYEEFRVCCEPSPERNLYHTSDYLELDKYLVPIAIGTPTKNSHAATKKYVDDGLSKSGIINYKDQINSSCIGNYINNSQQACVNTFPNGDKFAIINLAFKFSNSYTSGTEFEIMNFPTELIPSKNVVLQFYAGRSIGFAYLNAASKSIIATMPIDVSASTEINLLGYYQIV